VVFVLEETSKKVFRDKLEKKPTNGGKTSVTNGGRNYRWRLFKKTTADIKRGRWGQVGTAWRGGGKKKVRQTGGINALKKKAGRDQVPTRRQHGNLGKGLEQGNSKSGYMG